MYCCDWLKEYRCGSLQPLASCSRCLPIWKPAVGLVVALFTLLGMTLGAGVQQPPSPIRLEFDVKVPMRDGILLSTDIYRPDREGKFPVLVMRTPYDNQAERRVKEALFFAERGYVFLLQDVRGRYDSDGEWRPFVHEADDGYDTIEWAAGQPWSNGKVGMLGGSYQGLIQWLAASGNPPHLRAIFPVVASSNLYHHWAYSGGAFQLAFNLRWGGVEMTTRTNQDLPLWMESPNHYRDILWKLPLISMPEAAGRRAPAFLEWIRHPSYDSFWEALNIEQRYERISVAAYNWGGWYDAFLQSTLNNFLGMTEKGKSKAIRNSQKIRIGPWGHDAARWGPVPRLGDVDFGSHSYTNIREEQLRWFDFWLKDLDTAVLDEPSVRIFVMGSNQWREEEQWPPEGTDFEPFFFHSKGSANTRHGDGSLSRLRPDWQEPPDSYLYDPDDPVPTTGGKTCCGDLEELWTVGPRDQRSVEERSDVLCFTSPPLETAMDVMGPVRVNLYASSNAPDTDFVARLVDVFPDGTAINLSEGIVRARFRNSYRTPSLLETDQVYLFQIDLWSTANRFRPGHRIRVDITSSNFPHFDRNPNTGHTFGRDAEVRVARQKIFHDPRHSSHIVLPVVSTTQAPEK